MTVSLSAICVPCHCRLQLNDPEAPGPGFVSSHPLCIGPELALSPGVSPVSLRGVELEAELNRWAAVSPEWFLSNWPLRGWPKDEEVRKGWGLWGTLITKRLSLVWDKLLESHWDDAKTQVTGERWRAKEIPAFTVTKSCTFTDVECCFTSNTQSFTMTTQKGVKQIWNLTSSNL